MRTGDMTTLWATSPLVCRADFETVSHYVGLRPLRANLQTDVSELDAAQYGQTVKGMVKLRADRPLPLREGDMLYLDRPQAVGSILSDGAGLAHYPPGDYCVEGVSAGVWERRGRNPTTVRARRVV